MVQEEAFARGDFHRVPLMIGVTRDEGLYNAAKYILYPQALANLNDNWDEIGPKIVFDKKENVTADEMEIVSRIRQFYFGNNDIDETQIQPLVNMFSDKTFWSSVHRIVSLIADQPASPPVYLYMFSHPGAWSFAQLMDLPPGYGVCHADDVHYLFQPHLDKVPIPSLDGVDRAVRNMMVTLWVDFIQFGDPTPPGSFMDWGEFSAENPEYLEISTSPRMTWSDEWTTRVNFWDTLFPKRAL